MTRTRNTPIAALLTSVLVLATSSCSGAGSSIVGSTLQDVQSFQAAAGNNQVGTVGSDLPTPITVRALAKSGQGVSGISVQWTFSGGGGSLTPGGTVSQSLTTVTDKQGKSSVYWQLDTIAGDQTATATLSGTSSNSTTSVKFQSRGKAGGPARLVVSPGTDTLAVGDSAQFTATVLDRWKNVISGATVSWSSSNDSVLTVNSTGMAKAVRSGSARVIATTSASSTSASGASSISGGASVSVESSTAGLTTGTGTPTVTVTPASLSFTSLNATAQLSAVAKDSTGNTVINPGFTWKSLATSIATVSTAGLVTARAVGATTIIVTAACCGSDTASVTVDTLTSSGQVTPYFQDGFESGNLSHTQNGFAWKGSNHKVGDSVVVSTDMAHSGTHSLKFFYAGRPTGQDGWAEQRYVMANKPKEVWMEWWIHFPSNFVYRYTDLPDNNKLWACWTDVNAHSVGMDLEYHGQAATSHTNEFTIWNDTSTNLGDKYVDNYSMWANNAAVAGAWHHIQIHLRAGNGTTDLGAADVWFDGKLVLHARTNQAPLFDNTGHDFWYQGYLMGWANSGFASNTAFYIDDFKVYTTNPGW